jgi:hypothetical protein
VLIYILHLHLQNYIFTLVVLYLVQLNFNRSDYFSVLSSDTKIILITECKKWCNFINVQILLNVMGDIINV